MKTWPVIIHTEGQPDETIELTEESRRLLLAEAKARSVHPEVILREACQERQATRLKWRRLQVAANECASLVKAAPEKVDHNAVAVTLLALIGGILRGAVKRGELGGIQNVVIAADSLASEIERAHKLHPEKLRKLTEKLPKLTVSISRGAVADDNPGRRQVREFLVHAGVGRKSIPPTGTKTRADLAEMFLREIKSLRDAVGSLSAPSDFLKTAYRVRPVPPCAVQSFLDVLTSHHFAIRAPIEFFPIQDRQQEEIQPDHVSMPRWQCGPV